MAIWLFRAGKLGQHESKFLEENRVYLTWDDLNINLSQFKDKKELQQYLLDFYATHKPNTVRNWLGQIWPLAHEIKIGDWIILPSKMSSSIHIGKVSGQYTYDPTAINPYFHYLDVKWVETNIPRSNFDQDLLYSFGAFLTICRITRNDAEIRISQMEKNDWRSAKAGIKNLSNGLDMNEDRELDRDLELVANDQIAKHLIRKFSGHDLEILIEAILKAKGYTTYRSPVGPDHGVDILAAPEPMGFGSPKLCVQVKSGDQPIERTILDQLIGVMQNFHANQGLLVSWGGFKKSIIQEIPRQFFNVRLWGQREIIHELQMHYDQLDDEIKAEIPLKRVWTLTLTEEE